MVVYQIKNTINNKCYVGSTVNKKRRWYEHRYFLQKGTHFNKHLQSAYNKYGKENLIFLVLEEVKEQTNLVQREKFWIDELRSFASGYNKSPHPEVSAMFGIKHSEESKKLMSEKRKLLKYKHTPEVKNKISEAMKTNRWNKVGFMNHSEETKNKIRAGVLRWRKVQESLPEAKRQKRSNQYIKRRELLAAA